MAETTLTIDQAYALACDLHRSGRMEEAEGLYRRILAAEPRHADTLHQLGLLGYQCGHLAQAADLIRQALSLYESGIYLTNLSAVLMALDQPAEAEQAALRAVALQPELSEPCVNVANALERQQRFAEAASWFGAAMSRGGDAAEMLVRQGAALEQAGRPAEALPLIMDGMARGRRDAVAYYHHGRCLHEMGRYEEAAESYRAAREIDPRHASALMNLGLVCFEMKRIPEADQALRAARDLAPDSHVLLYNISRFLKMTGRITEAMEAAQRAISIRPDFGMAYMALGNACHAGGRFAEALAAFRRARELAPNDSDIHDNVIASLSCDDRVDGLTLLAEYKGWNDAHLAGIARLPHANSPEPGRRLRIGYLSPDFRDHAVAYFLTPLLAAHDRTGFEVVCYSMVAEPDDVTRRFMALADGWRDIVNLNDDQVAALIQEDGIDILVDCVGHTQGKRMGVFARKPAPVQAATLIGHDGTTGIAAIDYVMGDPYLTPPGYEALFSETLVRLPRVIAPFLPRDDWPDVFPLPGPEAPPLLGCFAEPARIGDSALAMWRRILDRLPGARLLLKQRVYGAPDQARYWRERFQVLGDRFDLEGIPNGWRANMDVYRRLTLMLDTYPLTGATSSLIPLWMGVPVVSLAGDYPGRRYGATMLANAGVPELVVDSPDAYVDLAVALAQDRARLAAYRQGLRDTVRASPLLDAAAVTADVEACYRGMWAAWCGRVNGGSDAD